MAMSIFDRCGGFAKVRKIVSDFYDKVLDSPTLQHHFEGIDMRRLVDHQTKFITYAMGGPATYDDEALRRAHANLKITPRDFGEMTALLRETMEDHGLEPADVEHVLRELTRREIYVVTSRG